MDYHTTTLAAHQRQVDEQAAHDEARDECALTSADCWEAYFVNRSIRRIPSMLFPEGGGISDEELLMLVVADDTPAPVVTRAISEMRCRMVKNAHVREMANKLLMGD